MSNKFFRLCINKEDHESFIDYAKNNLLQGKPFSKGLSPSFNKYPCYIGIRPSYGFFSEIDEMADGYMPEEGGYDWYLKRGYEPITPSEDKKDAVFVCFKTDDQFLMIRRKDGSWGFPGGKVEDNESRSKAASREVKEEIDVSFHSRDMKIACSHPIKPTLTSHLFIKKVKKHFLLDCLNKAVSGKASHSHEITGAALFNIKGFKTEGMVFAPTVLEEIKEVLGYDH